MRLFLLVLMFNLSLTASAQEKTLMVLGDSISAGYGIGLQRAQTRDDLGDRDYTILTFPFTAKFDRRDDPLNATSGYYAEAGVRPFLNLMNRFW